MQPRSSHISCSQRDGVWVVGLSGEHDLASAPEVEKAVEAVLAPNVKFAVDLTGATFLDSSIVSVFLRVATGRGETAGSQVAAVVPPGSVAERVFEVVRLQDVIPMYPDLETAIRALRLHGPDGDRS